MKRYTVVAISAALAIVCARASAQSYPDRPVTMLVPFAAGGPLDLTARVLGEHMARTLGQPLIIENLSGGGGTLATQRVAKSSPDGHLLMIQQPALAANVTLFPNAPFNPEKDLVGIALLNQSPLFLLAGKSTNAKSMPELVSWMKRNDKKIRFAHAGVGSLSHLCAALFANAVGVTATMIPYRGGTPAISDTMAGHTDLYCSSAQLAISQIKAGTLAGIAVTADARMALVGEVPTTAEVGFGKVNVTFWQALFAAANTPSSIVDKLGGAVRAALSDPAVQKRFEDVGMTVYPPADRTSEPTNALLRREIAKWAEVIRSNNIQASSQ